MTPSRKEREQQFRVALVLAAAESVFAEHGFQGASVEEIARRTELSVGSLYNLFPSKEALFAATLERRQEEYLAEVNRELVQEPSPLEKLERLAAFTFTYFAEHEDLFRLYLGATSGFLWNIRPALGERTYQTHLRMLDTVAGICREGTAAGAWPRGDAQSLAWVVTGMLNALLTGWVTGDRRRPLTARIEEAQEFIRRIVGAGAARAARVRGR